MSETCSDRRKTKELRVFELYQQGLSYRKIAKEARLSLRDVAKFVHRISNKAKSPSTSVIDGVVLEYTVNLLRSEVTDLRIEGDSLKNEVTDLRAQKYNLQIQVRAKQSELDTVKRGLEDEKFSKEILNDIFTEGH
ncbi:MAG: hypothetical protein ACRD47_07535 [Nitrososphaeraceae archaeon]